MCLYFHEVTFNDLKGHCCFLLGWVILAGEGTVNTLHQQSDWQPWTLQDCTPWPPLWTFRNSLTGTNISISSEGKPNSKWTELTTEMNIIPIKFTFYHGQYQTGSWPQPQSCPTPQLSAPLLPCTHLQSPTALKLDKDLCEFSPKLYLHPYLTQQVSLSPALPQLSAPRTGPY